MITRIEIDGFKSLRDVAVDLDPLTAIVGPNGSGKSNFVEALRLVARLAGPDPRIDRALAGNRGTIEEQFARLGDGRRSDIVRIGVELLLGLPLLETVPDPTPGLTRCRYEVEIALAGTPDDADVPIVRRESLRTLAWNKGWFAAHPQWRDLDLASSEATLWERSSENAFMFGFRDERVSDRSFALRLNIPALSLPASAFTSQVGQIVETVAASLRHVKVLHGEPARLRASSDPKATPLLDEDGGNLPTVFNGLSPDARVQVVAQLARLVPGLRGVEVRRGADELLALRFKLGNEDFPARLVSDGTLRLLALLVHVHASTSAGVAVVEEPENGVHPASLRELTERLREATAPSDTAPIPPQVILVSHSPALVAALEKHPRSLVFTEMALRGDVRFTRLLHVRREGEAPDQGRTSVSPRQVQRLLETAAPAERA